MPVPRRRGLAGGDPTVPGRRGGAPARARLYPWGDEFDPNRANTAETGIGTTSAVGIFPGGASPYGVLDMSGNVWEWCATRWQDRYPLPREDEWSEAYLSGTDLRVLRGGAFVSNQHYARCAYRFRYYPNVRSGYFGFRIVVSPISPRSALGSSALGSSGERAADGG